MSVLPGGISMGMARQTGTAMTQTFKRFARENRMIGNCFLPVLNLESAGEEGRGETIDILNGKRDSFIDIFEA